MLLSIYILTTVQAGEVSFLVHDGPAPRIISAGSIGAPVTGVSSSGICDILFEPSDRDRLVGLTGKAAILPKKVLTKYVSWGAEDGSLHFHALITTPRHQRVGQVIWIR